MRTNIVLDDELVMEAMRLTGAPTKRAVVEQALRTLVAEQRRRKLVEFRGKIRFREGYDPGETRRR